MIVEIRNDRGALLGQANLRDLSANGALIHMARRQTLPDKVALFFPADRLSKSGRVRWQSEQFVGIAFDDPVNLPESMRYRRNRLDVVALHLEHAGFSDQSEEHRHVDLSS